MRMVMGHGPYAKLVMGFLFTSLGFMVRTTHASADTPVQGRPIYPYI